MGRRGAPVTSLDGTAAGRGGAPGIDERRDAGGGVVDGEGNEPPPPPPMPTPTSTSTATFRPEGFAESHRRTFAKLRLPVANFVHRMQRARREREKLSYIEKYFTIYSKY